MGPAPTAKTERLMNVVMTLLSARRALTRDDLRRSVEQYRLAPSAEAFERMFERDKDELRELGVPLLTVEADALFEDEAGYRIRSEDYVLPEISFDPEELVILGLAARTWSHGTLGDTAAQALRKLQATRPEASESTSGLVEPRLGTSEPTFPDILRAVQELREIRFRYRRMDSTQTEDRRVQPWLLSQIRGHWYVTGFDLDRGAERVFRLSRVDGRVTRHGPPGAYSIPSSVTTVQVARTAVPEEELPSVEVEVAEGSGLRLRRHGGEVPAGSEPGWSRLAVRTLPFDEVVAELAGLLDRVRRIEPPEVREAVGVHLEKVAQAHTGADLDELAARADAALDQARGRARRRHGSIEPATERLSRLLAMVPWLVHRQGIDLAEAARGLGVGEDQLRADLDLLFMCGYGSLPDELIEVESDGGRIYIHNADTIAQPLRLRWDEALSLIVGLRALADVPGLHDGEAIGRTLRKLEEAAGDLAAAANRVSARIDDGLDSSTLGTLRSALEQVRRVRLVYDGAEKDERSERDVDLMRVVRSEGRWYAEGWCHRARDTRLFRLDRIRGVEVLDVDGTPPDEAVGRDLSAGTFQAPQDAQRVVLHLQPGARWVSEYYPVEAIATLEDETTGPAGTEVVQMRVSRIDWLLRLLSRLGGAATVLSPASVREQLVERVAAAAQQHQVP
ncbi:MAG: WYL domain-containing protein [Actinomycetia bacterium]|nr:WYL domain-containing protein [Actinomycetes bacterium]